VYCVESVDQPGQRLDDIVIDPGSQPVIGDPVPALGGITPLRLAAERRRRDSTSWWPYSSDGSSLESPTGRGTVTAIPYYAWGNREPGAMRVWLRMLSDRPLRRDVIRSVIPCEGRNCTPTRRSCQPWSEPDW
jgi:uncharacterized protein